MSKRSDDYKPLNFYKKHAQKVQNGASKFSEGGEHWFAWFKDGEIELISEGYKQTAGRDNGIKSLSKNMKLPARYKVHKHSAGKFYYDVLAGNGQSVATSVWKSSEAGARAAAAYFSGTGPKPAQPAAKAKAKPAKTKAKPAKAKAANNEDDYRPLAFFERHIKTGPDGINMFKGDDGEFYFVYRENGKIAMISEGYPTEAARDTGVASVLKNLPEEKRYKFVKMKNGKHEFRLHAGNHKEIARSVWYSSAAAAATGAAYVMGTKKRAAAKSAKAKPAKTKSKNNDDDYRPLAFYTKQTKGSPDGIEKFKGDDGEYYFTYNENGKIAMISEGYPKAAARDKGAASVMKNRELEKRYSYVKLKNGKHEYRLKAGNGQEIARSVWFGSAAAAATGAAYVMGTRKRSAPKPKKPAPKAAPVVAAAAVAATAAAAGAKPRKRKDDDYLRCAEYHNRPVTDAQNNLAAFTHENGQHYFAVYDNDGDVRIRSEGFANKADRQSEMNAVLRNIDNEDRYKEVTNGEYTMDVLYDENEREIGRSCLGKVIVAPVAAPIAGAAAMAPVAAAPIAAAAASVPPAAAAAGGGWGWLKWLIPLLLLLALALFGLSKCNDGKAALAAKAAQAEQAAATAKAAAEAKAAAAAAKAAEMKAAAEAKARAAAAKAKAEAAELAAKVEVPAVKPAPKPAPKPKAMVSGLNVCGYSDIAIFSVPASASPVSVSRLGTYPEFGDSHALTPVQFFEKLQRKYSETETDRQYLDYLFRSMGYKGGFKDADASIVSNATLPLGTAGLLGLGVQHHYDYTRLDVTDPRDLEAFLLQSKNDQIVHFMKTCGNYMYACK